MTDIARVASPEAYPRSPKRSPYAVGGSGACRACPSCITGFAVCTVRAHLLRDLRSISDADPDGQVWATAMATTLTDANRAAHTARERDADRLDEATLKQIRNHYLGARARGRDDNQDEDTALADKARTLIARFRRFENMILRFATDLSVPFTNNAAERACRPVKIQQRTSGGCWRTLQGLTDFAIVQSYLDTTTK
ncbi:transposase [Amycolatopsis alkalitolerans]|uniref:Transposase n=1 Tax=Amycolatopsis alkalitolerans TaxID=2547244 RepID=A0A5C4M1Y8_9PSEU|nr:transposase [Amycolatopsis alkalitolerans]